MKDAITWTLIGLAFFASIFGAYQIFIDDGFALYECGDATLQCEDTGDNCSNGAWPCYCVGSGSPPLELFYCWPGEPFPR